MATYVNTGLLFNKHYFKDIDFNGDYKTNLTNENTLKNINKNLISSKLDNSNPSQLAKQKITLLTTYPGLVSGTGYAHESGVKGEFKLGFFFDYTTGLPVLPGSSVKGVLCDAFKKDNGNYIKYLLEEELNISNDLSIKDLEKAIFENNEENKSIYDRDFFFDAFPVGKTDKFLASDYITPHLEPLKNPIPIQFLKVLPNVQFQFNFDLKDFKDKNGTVLLSAEQKIQLFKLILLDLGIGAKTNVGYGQLVEPERMISLDEINVGDNLKCNIDQIIYRDAENRFQVYLKPQIEQYENYLSELDKPYPSIKVIKAIKRQIETLEFIQCNVSRKTDDGRVLFSNKIIFE